MRIFDCFTFYNEIELVEYRLKLLADVVDYFVIAEMNVTFTNQPKKYNLELYMNRLSMYRDKIRYIKIDIGESDIDRTNPWNIEFYQRDSLINGLNDILDDDLVMMGDVDEIPDPRVLTKIFKNNAEYQFLNSFGYVEERQGFKPRQSLMKLRYFLGHLNIFKANSIFELLDRTPIVFEQEMFMFFVNFKRKSRWCSTILMKSKFFKDESFSNIRFLRNLLPTVVNGWHFSYLGGVDAIVKKISATSDGGGNPLHKISQSEQKEFIYNFFNDGRMWWNNNEQLECMDYHEIQIPEIEWFIKKYPKMYR